LGYQDHDLDGTCEPACTTAVLGCAPGRVCDDTSGTPTCVVYGAASCAEIRSNDPTAASGTYWLAAGGDRQLPFQVFCDTMDSSPAEYLDVNPDTNYSTQLAGGYISGTNVVTRFSRVRIDPVTLTVKLDDFAYSSSTGFIDGWNMTRISYATGAACNWYGAGGNAGIDLTTTRFTITEQFCSVGWAQWGSYSPSSYTNQVTLTGGGQCGSEEPCTVSADGYRLHLALPPCPGNTMGPGCGLCLTGYQGASCDTCAPGFHDPGTGVCIPD
jgi:hypothetical protein